MKNREQIFLFFIPILFTLHNLEEFLFFISPKFPNLPFKLPVVARDFQNNLTKPAYTIALILVTLIAWGLWMVFLPNKTLKLGLYILQATVFFNALVHILAVFLTRQYQMGFGTAILINLPFSAILFTTAFKHQWIQTKQIPILIIGTVLFHGPILFLILWVSSKMMKTIF